MKSVFQIGRSPWNATKRSSKVRKIEMIIGFSPMEVLKNLKSMVAVD
jgi:hypothetical protein